MNKTIKRVLLSIALAIPLITWIYLRMIASQENKIPVKTFGIAPPVKEADIPSESYFFSNDSSVKITRNTGTTLRIQPGSFVREDGKPLKGVIEMRVREFHSASDILRAGINMSVNPAADSYLQSAGMIEIRAFNEGNPLEVAANKDIEVGLAGYRSSENYRLYYFDDDREWGVTDTFAAQPNSDKIESLTSLSIVPPKPIPGDSAEKEDRIFYFDGDRKQNPKIAAIASRGWRILDEYYNEKRKENSRINWDDVSITPVKGMKDQFEIVLRCKIYASYDDTIIKTDRFRATPVLSDDKGDQAAFERQLKKYNELLAKMEEEKRRVEQQADMLNTFKINKLGVYNIDRLFRYEPQELLPVTFDFLNEVDSLMSQPVVYGVYEDDQSVIPYPLTKNTRVYLPKGKRTKFICVLNANQLAVVEYDAIKNVHDGPVANLFLKSIRHPAVAYLKKS